MTVRASITIRCDHHTETDRGDRQCMAIFTGHRGDPVREGAALDGWVSLGELDFCPAHAVDADALAAELERHRPIDA
jgi:hypothetical protein